MNQGEINLLERRAPTKDYQKLAFGRSIIKAMAPRNNFVANLPPTLLQKLTFLFPTFSNMWDVGRGYTEL